MDCIISGAIKCSIFKYRRLITPIGSHSINYTGINNRIIRPNKAEIIFAPSLQSQILECNCLCTVETVIAVIFSIKAFRSWVCTNVPVGLINSLTLKGQVFLLSILFTITCAILAAHVVQRIVTLGQLNGITAFGGLHRLANAPIRLLCCRTDSILRIITIYRIHVDCFANNRLPRKYARCDGKRQHQRQQTRENPLSFSVFFSLHFRHRLPILHKSRANCLLLNFDFDKVYLCKFL